MVPTATPLNAPHDSTTPLELPFPIGVSLDAGETVRRLVYQHPFALLPAIFGAIGLEMFSLLIGYAMGNFPETIPFPPNVLLSLMLITSLLAVTILLVSYYVYRHNVLIFTNVHLIYVHQVGLFGRRVSQLNFRNVEDVSGHKKGILQTLFNYGDVMIQSAGEVEKFIFEKAPNPSEVADDALLRHELCLRNDAAHGISHT